MADSPYTSVSISGYNSNPPADDASQVASNQLTWAKHKDKLGDPLKNLSESINTNVVAAFSKTINTDPDQNNPVAGSIAFTSSELTIGAGTIEVKRSHHTIDTELDTATDALDTIDNASTSDGAIVYLRAENSAREVTIGDGVGNITTFGPVVLSTTRSVAFQRVGTNWLRISEKELTIVDVLSFGIVGDGAANDTANLLIAMTFTGTGKTIYIDNNILTDAFSIPDNSRIIFGPNGKITLRTTTAGIFVEFGSNIIIEGEMRVAVPTSITVQRAVGIIGNNNTIDRLRITSVDLQVGSASSGIRVDGTDNYISYVSIDNYRLGLADQGVRNVFGFITADNWRLGIWVNNGTDGLIGGYYLWNTTVPTTRTNGEDGILTEGIKNYSIGPGTVFQAPEFGIYISGPGSGTFSSQNVVIATPNLIRCGGPGVKIQGSAGQLNENVNITDVAIVDCNLLPTGNNNSFEIERTKNCTVTGTTTTVAETITGTLGAIIDNAENLNLNIKVADTFASAIEIQAIIGPSDGIHIHDLVAKRPDKFTDHAGVNILPGGTFDISNVNVYNAFVSGYRAIGRLVAPSGGNTLEKINFLGGNGENTTVSFDNGPADGTLYFTDIIAGNALVACRVGSSFYNYSLQRWERKLYDEVGTGGWVARGADPVVTTTQRDAIVTTNLPTGFLVNNTTTAQHEYWNGAAWAAV